MQVANLNWLNMNLERGSTEFVSQPVIMTPEVACEILKKNLSNRGLKEPNLVKIKSDLEEGRWRFNGEPVIISSDGFLNDGQHRLLAIAQSGVQAPMVVSFGLSFESRLTVDQGSARTAGNYLSMLEAKNAELSGGIARIILMYEAGDGTRFVDRARATPLKVVERAQTDPKIEEVAAFASSYRRAAAGLFRPSPFGAAYYVASGMHKVIEPNIAQAAKDYFHQVATGELIKLGDPAFAVRHALLNLRQKTSANQFELFLRGWAATRDGRDLKLAKVLGTFPGVS